MISLAHVSLICTISGVLSSEGCSKKNLVLSLCSQTLIVFLNKITGIIFDKKTKTYVRLDFDAEISNLISKILNFLSPGSSFEDSSFKNKF